YVQTARSKGLVETTVIWKHAVRNALHPLVMALGGSLPALISGEVIVSIVLSLPTTGPLYINSLLEKDMYLAITFLIFLSIMLVVGNLLADLLLAWVDPRVRLEWGATMATANALTPAAAQPITKAKTKDVGQVSQFTLMRRRFMENRLSVAGLVILCLMYLVAALGPFLAPYPVDELDSNSQYAAPTQVQFINGQLAICSLQQSLDQNTFTWTYKVDCSQATTIHLFTHGYPYKLLGVISSDVHLFGVDPPAKLFLIGADNLGRDLLSRILVGSGISMTVGLVGVAIVIILGSVLGTTSGYLGGAVDNLIQRFIELLSSMPTLPLFAAMAAALPQDISVTQRFFLITVILSLIGWTGLARQVRGKVLAYRGLDYTNAARLAGAS